ncbi:MAG: aldo/keto reductase [Clostridium perfringens]|nr:aldo/keto reductase [Clostridium perfringens]
MDYIKLGNTGLDVSRICLGCMSFGDSLKGFSPWALKEDEARPLIKKALDLGINFFDTANIYSEGTSEEIIGSVLKEYGNRDEIVVSTKVYYAMHKGQNAKGLSRKTIMSEIDKSLIRLGMDYVDVYQIHRWDYNTPIEETMEALNDVVKAGKARYIGASSMHAWQFMKALSISEKNGWARFITMQNLYNLIYREEEREMIELCKSEKIGITPWSPLASGRLAKDWDEVTERSKIDKVSSSLYEGTAQSDKRIVLRVGEIAQKRGIPRSQVALAWVLSKDGITSPIVGSSKVSHLEDAVAALSVKLTPEEIKFLEEPYVPHSIVGFK